MTNDLRQEVTLRVPIGVTLVPLYFVLSGIIGLCFVAYRLSNDPSPELQIVDAVWALNLFIGVGLLRRSCFVRGFLSVGLFLNTYALAILVAGLVLNGVAPLNDLFIIVALGFVLVSTVVVHFALYTKGAEDYFAGRR